MILYICTGIELHVWSEILLVFMSMIHDFTIIQLSLFNIKDSNKILK